MKSLKCSIAVGLLFSQCILAQKNEKTILSSQGTKGSSQKELVYNISGKITQTHSYCGGAAPSEEMLKEYSNPKPYKGKTLYVRPGSTNNVKQPVLLKFVADSAGKFSFQLKPGTYAIIQAEQVKELNVKNLPVGNAVQADQECLKAWWKKPYYLLVVKDKKISGLNFNFHHPCFITSDVPCLQYMGPMPP